MSSFIALWKISSLKNIFHSSDEAVDLEDWKRARSESGTAVAEGLDNNFTPNSSVCAESQQYVSQKRVSEKKN